MLRKSEPFSKPYLFHFHTTVTDGLLSVRDYFEQAANRGLAQIIFLEHIRREPTYDVDLLIQEIERCEKLFEVEAVVGFEAKILPGGRLDLRDEHARLAQVIGIAEHGFAGNATELARSFEGAVQYCRHSFSHAVLVWAHPGLWFTRHRNEEANGTFEWMLGLAVNNRVLLERNLKHGLISPDVVARLAPEVVVTGLDAHRMSDLDRG